VRGFSYGRTVALRLIMQPCDEVDQFFSLFCLMEHEWNEIDRGKPKYSGGKPVPVPLCPPPIPHGLTRDRTRASAVKGLRLTAWAMARPFTGVLLKTDVLWDVSSVDYSMDCSAGQADQEQPLC
jgi:hypothetical protein